MTMLVESDETMPLRTSDDVVRVRQAVRKRAVAAGFSLVDQIEVLRHERRVGVRLTFTDQGPGIADLALALTDGHTTGNGLGLGLSGAKRLSNEFSINSAPGHGTKVMLARWK
jgi:serine/threonine-protein kinase RsbT